MGAIILIPAQRADLPQRSEADQAAFFAGVLDLAQQAEGRCKAIVHDLDLAHMRVRLSFAGSALEDQLLPALAHLLADDRPGEAPDLTIHIWDSASTGIAMGPPPVEKHCFSERGDIWTFGSQRYRSAFHYSEFSLNLMDAQDRIAVFWVEQATTLPYWTIASPFRTLFHWLAEYHDAQLIHAAAIGLGGRGVLITGKGGVGKSTCALSCLAAGFDYVGDDYLLLSRRDGLRAHSLYCTAKINAQDSAYFPELERSAPSGDHAAPDAKQVLRVTDRVVKSIAIEAVLTPRFSNDTQTSFEPVDHHYLMGAACYSTIAQLPHAGPQTSRFLEWAFRSVPCHQIAFGTDRAAVPHAIRAFLQSPRAPYVATVQLEAAPLVSVIIPVFNGGQFLAAAVGSIVAQAYPAIEIIVVDDGSDQDIAAIAASLPVQVRVLRQHNQGPAAARNLGIRAASADFLAFLDVDDLWPDRTLATGMRWLTDKPDTDVVIGRAQLFQDQDCGSPVHVGSPAESFDNYIGAALYQRRVFDQVGLFDPLLRFAEDSDWFARAGHFGARIDRLDMVTLEVRRHQDNMTLNRNGLELSPLRLLKNRLDLKRALARSASSGASPG